ncbi:uncharacterized protein TRIADDRAFT_62981 [Trichoplax adhaerens]|uniref:Mg chelatase-related protein C-terminal domain-containing protein n=1 Tax=Trichoplax adhaerens TaxID=10228 RepID=B3SFJ2_TRIAD|nr:hypothetical protein TRIADDRAFT_62981 [Trichoplax adhaerens]EDV18503.1 hypothetical protein TRIADDRAFT_62981 [Trichoplax adhaerens]|eukprot:XP_002119011.1 hypothetical protein TRIADDRAFT_62981 [Trichoplax adhaerens]
MNPSKNGSFPSERTLYEYSGEEAQHYVSKISGPLLDRIDLQVAVQAVSYEHLSKDQVIETSETILKRVQEVRKIQLERFENQAQLFHNAQMGTHEIKKFCSLDSSGQKVLEMAMKRLKFSARAYNRILKVARTIADLDQSEAVLSVHVAEAIQYRGMDRIIS